jgi:deoxyadenosine/deoxycytidine kinase
VILIINGPLGIGKSTTSDELLYRAEGTVLVEGDYLAAFHPIDFYAPAHLDYAYDLFLVVMRYHYDHGFRRFVVNWVFENAEQLASLTCRLETLGLPIAAYRLTAEVETIAARIRKRGREGIERELARGAQLAAILEAAAQTGFIGTPVATDDRTPTEVADLIWQDAHQRLALAAPKA